MRANPVILFLLLSLTVLIGGCSEANIDREAAANLISQSDEAANLGLRIPSRFGFIEEGEGQGLWVRSPRDGVVLNEGPANEIQAISSGHLVTVNRQKVAINVTGMTELGENSAISAAEFSWNYEDLPKYTRRFALSGGNGKATFQKFDDGWRLSSVSFSTSDNGYPLTEADASEISKDIIKVQEQKDFLLKRIQTSIEADQDDVIKYYEFDNYGVKVGYAIFKSGVATYADTKNSSNRYTGDLAQTSFEWFGLMENFRMGSQGVEYDYYGGRTNNTRYFHVNKYRRAGFDVDDFFQNLNQSHQKWIAEYGDIRVEDRAKIFFEISRGD